MTLRAPTLVGTLALVLVASALGSAGHAQSTSSFPGGLDALRAAVCPGRGACRIDPVVDAGRHGATSLAVVRVWSGPRLCCEAPAYRDYLVSARAGLVRRERLLVVGTCACLEWQPSSWSFHGGELRFTYTGMGAPPSAVSDVRPTTLHVQPWPLAITGESRGDERQPISPTLPARGPLVVLTME